jgi:hypothetical protein
LFIRSNDGYYSFKQVNNEDINDIKSTHILIESDPEKPLKAASNYKIEDLKQMSEIIGIQTIEKLKKAELYDEILKKIKY